MLVSQLRQVDAVAFMSGEAVGMTGEAVARIRLIAAAAGARSSGAMRAAEFMRGELSGVPLFELTGVPFTEPAGVGQAEDIREASSDGCCNRNEAGDMSTVPIPRASVLGGDRESFSVTSSFDGARFRRTRFDDSHGVSAGGGATSTIVLRGVVLRGWEGERATTVFLSRRCSFELSLCVSARSRDASLLDQRDPLANTPRAHYLHSQDRLERPSKATSPSHRLNSQTVSPADQSVPRPFVARPNTKPTSPRS